MAIVKKGKKVEKPGYPETFVKLAEKAATLQTSKSFFEEQYEAARVEIEEYLATEDCPVTVNVGEKGSNPKIDGICTIILSQPERLDNKAAAQKVAELLAEGKINAGDLVDLISQVNKEALSKLVDAATVASLVKRDETGEAPLQISVRSASEFKAEVGAYLDTNVLPSVLNRKVA